MQRRHFIPATLFAAASAPFAQSMNAASAPTANAPVLLVLGDSLSAEYGIARGSGWVALLERRLAERGRAVRIVNASISGDTTAGGRARLPALLTRHKPAVLIVELGSNDALQGTPLGTTRANLAAIIQAGKKVGARTLLCGQQMPPNYGADYTTRFAALFGEVAQAEDTALVPFFLKGVADSAEPLRLFQSDGLHPLAAAHPTILDNVWPHLEPLLP